MRLRVTLMAVIAGLAILATPALAQSGKRNKNNERKYEAKAVTVTIPVLGFNTKAADPLTGKIGEFKDLGTFTVDKKRRGIVFKLSPGKTIDLSQIRKAIESAGKYKAGDPQLVGTTQLSLDFGESKPDWRKFKLLKTQLRSIKNVVTTRPQGRGGFELVCKEPGTSLSIVEATIVKTLGLKLEKGQTIIKNVTYVGPPKKDEGGEGDEGSEKKPRKGSGGGDDDDGM